MPAFILDDRLASDTFHLGQYGFCQIRLHRNACYPWFILVPEVEVSEFFELSPEEQTSLIDLINQMSKLLKQQFAVEKLNIATIGNIVEQMHIHVIGRHTNDACWPGTVWGHTETTLYEDKKILEIRQKVATELGTVFVPDLGSTKP